MRPIIIFLSLILTISLQAQTAFEKNQEFNNGFFATVGYNQSTFLNPLFSKSLASKEIKRDVGLNIGTQYIRFPLLIDAVFFLSTFEVTNLPNDLFGNETTVNHSGIEVAASVSLIQNIKYFIPYAGIGYQTASLATPYINEENKNTLKEESSINVSSPIVKFGFLLKPYKSFGLKAEYKRSLFLDDNLTANTQLNISFIFNFSKFFKENA